MCLQSELKLSVKLNSLISNSKILIKHVKPILTWEYVNRVQCFRLYSMIISIHPNSMITLQMLLMKFRLSIHQEETSISIRHPKIINWLMRVRAQWEKLKIKHLVPCWKRTEDFQKKKFHLQCYQWIIYEDAVKPLKNREDLTL